MKTRSKWAPLLVAMVMIAALLVPFVGTASANAAFSMTNVAGPGGLSESSQGCPPTIIAGQAGVPIGELEILERVPGSLIQGGTITLTLPQNAVWAQFPSTDTSLSVNCGTLGATSQMDGADGRTMLLTVNGTTSGQSNGADWFLKNLEVNTSDDFSGPLTVTVGGSEVATGAVTIGDNAGVAGTVTLATVTPAVMASVDSAPTIAPGQAGQTVGDLTITEAAAGDITGTTTYSAIDTNSSKKGANGNYGLCLNQASNNEPDLYVVAPQGVTFDSTPTVTVSGGDIELGTPSTEISDSYLGVNNQGVLVIPIKGGSTTASTIKISGIQVTVENTVPQGPVEFEIEGPAVNQNTDKDTNGDMVSINGESTSNLSAPFPTSSVAARATGATVKNVAKFQIGQTAYTVNGRVYDMDVAPFIQDSRAFLPLRYIANAVGVADAGIVWNGKNQSVTIIRGSLVAQLTIGSSIMNIDNATIYMDTAPVIKDGRACLPVAWVAKALNADIQWDAASQTVTESNF